jgi:archaeal flagellin FlaB
MNLIRKGHRHNHRGVIGIESAIVLIAFVIVAAALAFVVLNMGFSTTQKAKTSIVATLAEAGSSLEIQGKVFGWAGNPVGTEVEVIGIPIKVASGGESVNLAESFTSVKYTGPGVTYDDIYEGVIQTVPEYFQIETAADAAVLVFAAGGGPQICDVNPIAGPGLSEACAFIYFTVNDNNNDILDTGEHAVLALLFPAGSNAPDALDKIKIELIPPSGAALTVERNIPNLSTTYVDLG